MVAKSTQTESAQPGPVPSHFKDILLLFSIPIGIAVLSAVFAYVPRLLAHPAYDFVYSYCPEYECSDSYSVSSDGSLSRTETSSYNDAYTQPTRLSYYDTSTNATGSINLSDAQSMRLLNSSKSPDNYILTHNTGGGGFLFYDDSQDSWQLTNGLKRRTINLGSAAESGNTITFLGWVNK